jgi:purine-binding chemotaxis protein CheW
VAAVGTDKLVCFTLAGQLFGLPIRAVKETVPARPLTRVPLVPDVVAGLLNLRGDVVAVLDLLRMLKLPASSDTAGHVLILRSPRSANRAVAALCVEELLGVREVSDVHPPPATLAVETAQFLAGVAQDGDPPRPLLIIDPTRVLDCEPLKPHRARTT